MDPLIGSALIGAAGSLFNIGAGKRNERRNKRLMEHELGLNKQMFDYQNAYNTPAQQVKRMKEAGLNPALMYGQGTTGNASNAPQTRYTPTQVTTDVVGSLASNAQLALIESQKKNIDADTIVKLSEGDVIKDPNVKRFRKGLFEQDYNFRSHQSAGQFLNNLNTQEQFKVLKNQVSASKWEAETKRIEMLMNDRELNIQKKLGVSKGSTNILRMFYRFFGEGDAAIEQIYKMFGSNYKRGKFRNFE